MDVYLLMYDDNTLNSQHKKLEYKNYNQIFLNELTN